MRTTAMRIQKTFAIVVAWTLLAAQLNAQQSSQSVQKASVPVVLRPYLPPSVPPVRLTNSSRIHDLIRGGKLYLTVQDAIALAIENDLDLEVDRYGPLTAEWALERFQGGGALRGVTNGNSLVN